VGGLTDPEAVSRGDSTVPRRMDPPATGRNPGRPRGPGGPGRPPTLPERGVGSVARWTVSGRWPWPGGVGSGPEAWAVTRS